MAKEKRKFNWAAALASLAGIQPNKAEQIDQQQKAEKLEDSEKNIKETFPDHKTGGGFGMDLGGEDSTPSAFMRKSYMKKMGY